MGLAILHSWIKYNCYFISSIFLRKEGNSEKEKLKLTEDLHSFLADMTLEVPTWWHVKPQYKTPYDQICQMILDRTLLKNQEIIDRLKVVKKKFDDTNWKLLYETQPIEYSYAARFDSMLKDILEGKK